MGNNAKPKYLFESGNEDQDLDDNQRNALKTLLAEAWKNRPKRFWWGEDDSEEDCFDESDAKQQFVKFTERGIQAWKYVGVIRLDNLTIHLLPKIFYREQDPSPEEAREIFAHLLWWLRYCFRNAFPKAKSVFGEKQGDFLEVLIYLFASFTKDFLNRHFYQTYVDVQEETSFMKGRLDVEAYLRDNLVTGRWHRLSCVHDSFQMDNRFNRILKHTARLLFGVSRDGENQRMLSDALFLLDDVSDLSMTPADCDKVHVNPLFQDMDVVLNFCRLFLSHCVIRPDQSGRNLITFLVPMERLFEEFVFGFLEKHFREELRPERQKKDLYLTANKKFQLKHDIVLTRKGEHQPIIADTKYKKIYFQPGNDGENTVNGISPGDMYQMVAYAIRRGGQETHLLYPETLESKEIGEYEFEVHDELASAERKVILIRVNQLPIIHEQYGKGTETLDWESQEQVLKKALTTIFERKTDPGGIVTDGFSSSARIEGISSHS